MRNQRWHVFIPMMFGTACSAQIGLFVDYDLPGYVSPSSPYVRFNSVHQVIPSRVFAVSEIRVTSSEPGLSNIQSIFSPTVPITGWPTAGTAVPIEEGFLITTGQNFNTQTPPLFLGFNIDWQTVDFTPRTIDIHFEMTTAYWYENSTTIPSPAAMLTPTIYDFQIQVIPAPSSALALLAGAGLVGVRRRR